MQSSSCMHQRGLNIKSQNMKLHLCKIISHGRGGYDVQINLSKMYTHIMQNLHTAHCTASHPPPPPPPNTITIVVHNHTVTAFITQRNLNLFCMNNLPSSFARWHQCLVCQTACLKPCEHFMNAPRAHVLTAAIYGHILNTTALWYASHTSSLSVTILVCLVFFSCTGRIQK